MLQRINSSLDLQKVMPLVILVLMVAVLTALNPRFLAPETLVNLMSQVSAIGVVAMGATFVIISGGIDFTSGNGIAMTGMAIAAVFVTTSGNVYAMVGIAILSGMCLGLLNGFLIAKLRLLPFIATLAVMLLVRGFSVLINGGRMVMLLGSPLLWFGQGSIGPFPVSFIIYLIVSCLLYILLNKTKFGIYVYAIGNNEDAARYSGINVTRCKVFIYVLAGFCTGLAALLTVTRTVVITPGISGSVLLDSIAAVIIGGTSLRGGVGNVFGTFIGVIIIVLISIALTFLEITPEMQGVFKGGVILVAVCFDAFVRGYSQEAARA